MNRKRQVFPTLQHVGCALFVLVLSALPFPSVAEIIWSGDYETGNFLQWHTKNDLQYPQLSGVPAYGRPTPPVPFVGTAPITEYGDGTLLSLVTNPVRQGKYAAKFTVRNSSSGSEPADCDNGVCTRRRSELNMHLALPTDSNGIPYMSERWLSISHYLPSDWDSANGSGFGVTVFQVKSPATNQISPTLEITISPNVGWRIYHRWSNVVNPDSVEAIPWQFQMFYDATYPTKTDWPDGMADLPDVEASRAALADLNKGGWTDWVIHAKFDARGVTDGGQGFLEVWKRAGDGPWVEVLNIRPKKTTRGGMTFDSGIGYNVPTSGFGPLAGLYMAKGQVWGLSASRVIYNDNVKVGGATSTFSEMSPDGSTPRSNSMPPKAPSITVE